MDEPCRILIVGCGAIGGIFAAHLAGVAQVFTYDLNTDHVDAIRSGGLRLTGATNAVARITAARDPRGFDGTSFDVVLFMIKSKATGSALAVLRPLLAEETLLVTLQNGMGNSELLLGAGRQPVARGVTMLAGRYLGPGAVEHLISGSTWLGPLRGTIDGVRRLGALMNAAGLATQVVPDPMGAVWAKFVFNCVMNPVGALLLGDNAARYASPDVRALIDDMAAECTAVVRALGGEFAFDPMEFVAKVRAGELPVGKHAGSMALDIARGVATEIDELTGYVVREGERLGIPVPTCKTVYRLVKGLELAAARRATAKDAREEPA